MRRPLCDLADPAPLIRLRVSSQGKSDEEIMRMKFYEIAHCRAAMLAFGGLVTVSAMYEKPFPYF